MGSGAYLLQLQVGYATRAGRGGRRRATINIPELERIWLMPNRTGGVMTMSCYHWADRFNNAVQWTFAGVLDLRMRFGKDSRPASLLIGSEIETMSAVIGGSADEWAIHGPVAGDCEFLPGATASLLLDGCADIIYGSIDGIASATASRGQATYVLSGTKTIGLAVPPGRPAKGFRATNRSGANHAHP